MGVSEGQINNIMGGMEQTAGVRLHNHRHKLKQRSVGRCRGATSAVSVHRNR